MKHTSEGIQKSRKNINKSVFFINWLEGTQMNQIHPLFVCTDRSKRNGNSKMIKNQIGSVCPNHQIDWLGHQYFEQLSRRVELFVVLRPLRLSLKYSRDKQL